MTLRLFAGKVARVIGKTNRMRSLNAREKAMTRLSNAVKLVTVVFLATVILAAACSRANKDRNDSASGRSRRA